MKKSIAFSIILCGLLLTTCSKVDKTLQENSTPAARSDYSVAEVTKDAQTWAAADSPKRHIGVIANTGSMLRTMDSTTIVLIEKLAFTDPINTGDILGYSNPALSTSEISHRLIRIESDGSLIFKGDSNDNEDPPVKRDAVTWRIVGILYTNGK